MMPLWHVILARLNYIFNNFLTSMFLAEGARRNILSQEVEDGRSVPAVSIHALCPNYSTTNLPSAGKRFCRCN